MTREFRAKAKNIRPGDTIEIPKFIVGSKEGTVRYVELKVETLPFKETELGRQRNYSAIITLDDGKKLVMDEEYELSVFVD